MSKFNVLRAGLVSAAFFASAAGAAGKVPVFRILKRRGKVYTRIVDDVSCRKLRRIIRTKVAPESDIYSDSFRS